MYFKIKIFNTEVLRLTWNFEKLKFSKKMVEINNPTNLTMQHLNTLEGLIRTAVKAAKVAKREVKYANSDMNDMYDIDGNGSAFMMMEAEENLEYTTREFTRRNFTVASLHAAHHAAMSSFIQVRIDEVVPVTSLNMIVASYI
jgi:hypothetical protein